MPKVSVITPCYNSARYIEQTVMSVRAQTSTDWEHLVVDDGSADGSGDVVRALAKADDRLRVSSFENGGCARARNRGFRQATNDSTYLFFLDADDLIEPQFLETMVRYLDAHPDVGLAYSGFTVIDEKNSLLAADPLNAGWHPRFTTRACGVRKIPDSEPETPFESIWAITAIIPSCAFFRRSIYEQTPGWDEDIGVIYEDVGLYLHMALRSHVHYVSKKLVRYRKHGSQSSMAVERFDRNLKRMRAKWDDLRSLTPEQRLVVRRAVWFHEGRFGPYSGVRHGNTLCRQGKLALAGRLYGGAIRRYLASFVSRPR